MLHMFTAYSFTKAAPTWEWKYVEPEILQNLEQ